MEEKQDFHQEFSEARNIIRETAALIKAAVGNSSQIVKTKGDHFNIVTETDEKAESFLREKLAAAFPDYGFIGEEGEEIIKDIAWIIDPIDGTTAFERNIPEFGIALALKKGDHVIFSLMYRIATDDLFSAYRGEGAFRNDEKLHVSETADPKNAVISVSHQQFWYERYNTYTLRLINQVRSFRISYSAVVESCYIAEGKLDMLIKFEQSIWDVAPEVLLMQEAGAKVTDEKGEGLVMEFSKNAKVSYIAANAKLHEACKAFLYF
jgi:myo-inositol-1(or 4)-monophosphatase